MSRDRAWDRSLTLRVTTGLPMTDGGQSHSWVIATSSSSSPIAQTISVADGSRDAILTDQKVGNLNGVLSLAPRGLRRSSATPSAGGWLQFVDRGSGRGLVRVPGRVDDGVVRPLGRQRLLGEDRVHRTFR